MRQTDFSDISGEGFFLMFSEQPAGSRWGQEQLFSDRAEGKLLLVVHVNVVDDLLAGEIGLFLIRGRCPGKHRKMTDQAVCNQGAGAASQKLSSTVCVQISDDELSEEITEPHGAGRIVFRSF